MLAAARLAVSHAVDDRVVIACCDDWEVRQHRLDDPATAELVTGGYLHLQLWCPASGISILTPSRLTAGLFDVRLPDGGRIRAHLYRRAADAVRPRAAPSEAAIAALERWHVLRHEPTVLHAARTWRDDPRRIAPLPHRGAAAP
jgi:hypothetical protein